MAVNSRGLAKSPDKLKTLYLYYHNAPMVTKHGRLLTYYEGLQPIKSHHMVLQDHLKTRPIIYPQGLWPSNLAEWWLTLISFFPSSYSTLWSRGLARSRDKLKSLYIHYQSAYDYHTWNTWKVGDLLEEILSI